MTVASVAIVQYATPPGNRPEGIFDFTPSTSYPAGGEPMTGSLFGILKVDTVIPSPGGEDGTRLWSYDSVNNKLRIWTAIGTEAGTGADQSSKKCRIVVKGL